MKLILFSILVLAVGVSSVYADDAEDWCKDQPGVKDEQSMKLCKDGYQWIKEDSYDDEQFKIRLSETEFEGVQSDESAKTSDNMKELLIENRDLKHEIINLQNKNELLESQIQDLQKQLDNAQQIIMTQLKVIVDTLANLKLQ